MIGFDHQPRTRIVYGVGAIERLGELAREIGMTRVLLVSDSGVTRAGHVDSAGVALQAAGIAVTRFVDVIENPTESSVEGCAAVARAAGVDGLIGLGGGSSLDTARACAFLLAGGGRMRDYQGYGKIEGPLLPLIAVPTTAGTGSECQSYALISEDETRRKLACGAPAAAARVALLDPALTLSQPRSVAVHTGLDAIVHAVETAVTTKRNPVSDLYSHAAFERLIRSFRQTLVRPDDLEARGDMQLGAAFAGLAIESSMLGAAHAAANPLTACYGLVHGHAVALMLPLVMQYNVQGDDGTSNDSTSYDGTSYDSAEAARVYATLARRVGWAEASLDDRDAAEKLTLRLDVFVAGSGLERSLARIGVPASALSELARLAAAEWTGRFNPRPIDQGGFEELYEAAWRPPDLGIVVADHASSRTVRNDT